MLTDNSVHAVITDPPYGSGGFTIKDKTASSKSKYVSSNSSYQQSLANIDGDSLHPDAWHDLMTAACKTVVRVLVEGGILAMFIDWRQMPQLQRILLGSGITLRGCVVWDEGAGTRPNKNGFRNQAEYLLWGSKGPIAAREIPIYKPGVLKHTTMTNNKVHITQKPEALMLDIIDICPPGGIVFDPFMQP